MNPTGQSAVFGRRKEPHTVIIARGNEIRHFTIRPWLAAFIGSALAAIAIGYLLATSYLVLRDDLIGATTARQARMQQAYEDRISALRAQVDRITSRQLLDQQLMETKVSELLERQTQLSQRHGRLADAVQFRITDDADDLDAGSQAVAHTEAAAERAPAVEVPAHERFVHDGDAGRAGAIAVVEIPPGDERHVERAQIPDRHFVEEERGIVGRAEPLIVDGVRAGAAPAAAGR